MGTEVDNPFGWRPTASIGVACHIFKREEKIMGRHYRSPCKLYLSILLLSRCTAVPKVSTGQATSASGKYGGQVKGQVSDPGGLPVPNVDVTLRNVLTGAATTARTGVEGAFIFRDLAPGSYALTASVSVGEWSAAATCRSAGEQRTEQLRIDSSLAPSLTAGEASLLNRRVD